MAISISRTSHIRMVTCKGKRTRGGITAFVVERETPGLSVGTIERKMGFRVLDKGRLTMGACALGAVQKLLDLCVA